MLRISSMNTYYGNIHALKGIDFEVNDGELVLMHDGLTAKIARGVNSAAAYVTGADVGSAATEWGG